MTRPADWLIAILACAGLPVLLTVRWWGPMVDAEQVQQVQPVPFTTAMRCPPWREGLSRTVAVIATEDESGRVTEFTCVRAKARGTL